MTLSAIVLLGAAVLGLVFGGGIKRLNTPPMKRGGYLLFAALGQVTGMFAHTFGVLMFWQIVSIAGVTSFLLGNRGRIGLPLVLAGLGLNLLCIGLNLGIPISVAAANRAGLDTSTAKVAEDRLFEPTDDHTLLPWLGEIVPVPLPHVPFVASPGDIVLAAGVGIFVFTGLTGRGRSLPKSPEEQKQEDKAVRVADRKAKKAARQARKQSPDAVTDPLMSAGVAHPSIGDAPAEPGDPDASESTTNSESTTSGEADLTPAPATNGTSEDRRALKQAKREQRRAARAPAPAPAPAPLAAPSDGEAEVDASASGGDDVEPAKITPSDADGRVSGEEEDADPELTPVDGAADGGPVETAQGDGAVVLSAADLAKAAEERARKQERKKEKRQKKKVRIAARATAASLAFELSEDEAEVASLAEVEDADQGSSPAEVVAGVDQAIVGDSEADEESDPTADGDEPTDASLDDVDSSTVDTEPELPGGSDSSPPSAPRITTYASVTRALGAKTVPNPSVDDVAEPAPDDLAPGPRPDEDEDEEHQPVSRVEV